METLNRPHQRKGAKSNSHVGREFEAVAQRYLLSLGIQTDRGFKVAIGTGERGKHHGFDLGSTEPPVVVECKCHRWTEGGNAPSAKVAVWNEAMYYFSLVPNSVRRILFVLHHKRADKGETLVDYYLRTYGHLAQPGVEIWEFDELKATHKAHLIS